MMPREAAIIPVNTGMNAGKRDWGGGQKSEAADSNIPLVHSKQAQWNMSFHTFLRILNWRYQK